MSKLKTLLEYQTVDIGLRRALLEIEKHPDKENLAKTKQAFEDAKRALTSAEEEATRHVEFFDEAQREVPPLLKEAAALSEKLEKTPDTSIDERIALTKQLEDIKERLSKFESRLADKKSKGQRAVQKFLQAQQQGVKLKDDYGKIKAKFDDYQKAAEPKIIAAKTKLAELKKNVDGQLLEKYLALIASNKFPPVVEAKSTDGGKSYSCTGCGLALSHSSKAQVLDCGNSQCDNDNCKRMIYLVK